MSNFILLKSVASFARNKLLMEYSYQTNQSIISSRKEYEKLDNIST